MKKKIFSIGMILVLVLSSMLLSATPASAGTLAWSTQGFLGLNQNVPTSDAALVRVAPNGDIFVVDTANLKIYKSTDGGRTYGQPPAAIAGATYIADLQISPAYETDSTVIVLAGVVGIPQVYISTNGGAVYGALGAALPAGTGTSLSIAPDYVGGFGGIIAGTINVFGGNVYQYTMAGWASLGIVAQDVLACAFSPNYPIDATIVAVTADAGATYLRSKVATGGWDVNIGGPTTITDGAGNFSAISADIAFPSDFNGSLAFNRTVYIAARGGPEDKVYRVSVGATAANLLNFNTLNDVPGFTGDDEATSIAYSGTQTAGTLYVGTAATAGALTAQVWRSTNAYPTAPPVLVSFLSARPAPSGTAAAPGQLTYVALAADYASSNTVYAGTLGAESALNVSTNGGAAFFQAGLIDTYISNIQDAQAVDASEIFVVTASVVGTPAPNPGGPESIWRTQDGGLSWYRISTFASTADTVIIRPSPDFATDGTLYLADVTGTAMMLSNDSGNTWTPRTAPAAIADVAVKDMYTIYVGCTTSQVFSSFNGGFFFSLPMAVPAAVNDIELDLGTGHILVGTTGGDVSISTNGSTFSAVGGANPFAVADVVTVAFDANYGSNNYIYAADTSGTTVGIWRHAYVPGPPTAWGPTSIDAAVCLLPADLIVAPDGTLYATDITPATAVPAGGMYRIVDPAAFPAPTMVELVGAGAFDGLTVGDTLSGMTMAEGSNIIWAINNIAAPNIRTYTDTFSTVSPAQVSPADGHVFAGATAATFVFEAVTGARSYTVRYSTRTDFLPTATVNLPVNAPLSAVGTGAVLVPGLTYYWQVQITAPLFGPWSQTWSFQTQLAPGAPNAPGILGPAAGGTNAGGYNAPLMPTFQWGTVPGATGYEFELATDSGMSNTIVAEVLTATAYQATSALDYSTTYYWRVRGVSATSETAWSPIIAFTTMDEPVVAPTSQPGTTVIVPTQPAPTINIPTQPAPVITITTGDGGDEVAPGYIWAVIIIGAVLVIALIVLIVRTRRTV